ncbi:MAG: GGDEF domain-containing protein [Candidatus Latescibacterota bacterium]|jgi:diguanylate cyclase (GGDEF)-like protein
MRSQERDYRYLLLNLIPQHRLPPDQRRDVELALVSGNREDLRRQSILALEQLCSTDYLERTGLRRTNGDVVADYKRKGGRYSVSVSVPADEWVRYVSDEAIQEPESPPQRPATPETPPMPPAPEEPAVRLAGSETLDFVPEITRAFSVAGRADPLIKRLESLLETLQRWLGVVGTRVVLLEEVANVTGVTTDWVETTSENELRSHEVYRNSIESGLDRLWETSETPEEVSADAPEGWVCLGVSPLYSMGKVCGVLKTYFGPDMDQPARLRRVQAAANLVKQAIEFNAQIETITSIDALTQLYNRHFYNEQISVEIERATRSGAEVSMLVIDVDDFHNVNEAHGHAKGDEALRAIADLIRNNLRKVDLPFRYGGEEFVILLPGTSEFESVHTAERLRRVIDEYTGFRDQMGRSRKLTVSVGVAVFPGTASTAQQLFEQADAAMFRAKEMGKNRVVLYKEGMTLGRG